MSETLISADSLFENALRLFRDLPLAAPGQGDDHCSASSLRVRLPRLVPVRPSSTCNGLLERLQQFSTAGLSASPASKINSAALRAGLFLWHDYLEESHQWAQSIEGEGAHQLGDYWHAILHRREPDYANARYWFRRIGRQPVFSPLRERAVAILDGCPAREAAPWRARLRATSEWEPFLFVELCESCAENEDADLARAARHIQLAELALLLEFTWNQI